MVQRAVFKERWVFKEKLAGVMAVALRGYNQCVYKPHDGGGLEDGRGGGGDEDVTIDVAADFKHSARVTSTKMYRSMIANMSKSEVRAISDPEELVAAAVKKSTIALDALGEAVRDTLQGGGLYSADRNEETERDERREDGVEEEQEEEGEGLDTDTDTVSGGGGGGRHGAGSGRGGDGGGGKHSAARYSATRQEGRPLTRCLHV